MDESRARARAVVLELLERRHGIGTRAERTAAWLELRLDRALDSLARSVGGDLDAAIELLHHRPAELGQLAEALRVGETQFYRDPPSWEAVRATLLPRFAATSCIRAVSVGCSTGEEAWTLAMLLDDATFTQLAAAGRALEAGSGDESRLPNRGGRHRRYRVVGVDRSELALQAARAGVYPGEAARCLPPALAERYLQREAESVRIVDTLRAQVTFVARDVMQGLPPGSYELIVCRNVLIYFGAAAGERAVQLLLRALGDGGALLVARSEVPKLRAMGCRAEELAGGVTVFRA